MVVRLDRYIDVLNATRQQCMQVKAPELAVQSRARISVYAECCPGSPSAHIGFRLIIWHPLPKTCS